MRVVFIDVPGRGSVAHVVTEAEQVTYPHVITNAQAARESERLKYLGPCGYTALHVREASSDEVAQWRSTR